MTGTARKSRVGPCMYCGEVRPYSREHVIPQWVRKQVFSTGPVQTIKMRTGERVRYDETLTLTVTDAVCKPCNGGWMKELGELVLPDATQAMAGGIIALSPQRRQNLATWAVDRALMFELAFRERRERYFAPPSNLRWVYEHRMTPIPPPGAQVFAACLHAPESLPAWSATGRWVENVLIEDSPALGYLAAFSIGHLVLVVFGQDFREPDHHALDGSRLGRLELPTRYGGYVVPLWPNADEVTAWPPSNWLVRDNLSDFANWTDASLKKPVRRGVPRL